MSGIIFNPPTEQQLAEMIRQSQCNQWLEENKNALDEYNRRIESHGTFSNGLRRF
ncbi:MAG: type II toxin-antitoxin system CcdA family antitoxin [Gallionella sp.]